MYWTIMPVSPRKCWMVQPDTSTHSPLLLYKLLHGSKEKQTYIRSQSIPKFELDKFNKSDEITRHPYPKCYYYEKAPEWESQQMWAVQLCTVASVWHFVQYVYDCPSD